MTAIQRIALPAPEQETVLWQGRPSWRAAAIRIWHVRLVVLYFALLLADGGVALWRGTAPPGGAMGEVHLAAIGLGTIGVLLLLAWLTHRTTRYTITDRRVVLRFGIALQATLAIPHGAIAHVGLRVHGDQTGDVALRLVAGQGVIYPKLWPHARPWALLRAEPMLRGVPQGGVVGTLLCRAVAAANAADRAGR